MRLLTIPISQPIIIYNMPQQSLKYKLQRGHSGSNQHEKRSPFTDFLETWYAHTLYQVTAKKKEFYGQILYGLRFTTL